MTDLIEFEEHEDEDEVHEGGVELDGDVDGADVEAGGHDDSDSLLTPEDRAECATEKLKET